MLKLCNIDIRRSEEIYKKLNEYVKEVVNQLNPKYVILFGSFAKGDISESSDIDIIVVADFNQNFIDRIKILLDINQFNLPIEAIGYTLQEFENLKKVKNFFITNVLEEGKFLYIKEGG